VGTGLSNAQIAALAEVFNDRELARQVVAEAGVPAAHVPWSAQSPGVFWHAVSELLANGAAGGGIEELLAIARDRFPRHPAFAEPGIEAWFPADRAVPATSKRDPTIQRSSPASVSAPRVRPLGDPFQPLATELILLRADGLALTDKFARDVKKSTRQPLFGGQRNPLRREMMNPGDRQVANDQTLVGKLGGRAHAALHTIASAASQSARSSFLAAKARTGSLYEVEVWAKFLVDLNPYSDYRFDFLDAIDQLAISLDGIRIDARDATLSGISMEDPDILADVLWNAATVWPLAEAAKIRKRSSEISQGIFQVRSARRRRPVGNGQSRDVRELCEDLHSENLR
jgi:hypothetical protein